MPQETGQLEKLQLSKEYQQFLSKAGRIGLETKFTETDGRKAIQTSEQQFVIFQITQSNLLQR